MPDIDDIRKFSSIIRSLGSEPAIAEERGEEIEDIQIKEGALPQDLSELLDDAARASSDDVEEYGAIENIAVPDEFGVEAELGKDTAPDLLNLEEPGEPADFSDMFPSDGDAGELDLGREESVPQTENEPEKDDFSFDVGSLGIEPEGDAGESSFSIPESDTDKGTIEPAAGVGDADFAMDFGDVPDTGAVESDAETGPEFSPENISGENDFGGNFGITPDTGADENPESIDFTLPQEFDLSQEPGEESGESTDPGTDFDQFLSEAPGLDAGGIEAPGTGAEEDQFAFNLEPDLKDSGIGSIKGFEGIGESFNLPEISDDAFSLPDENEVSAAGGEALPENPEEPPVRFEHEFSEETPDAGQEESFPSGVPETSADEFAIDDLGELELPEMGKQGEEPALDEFKDEFQTEIPRTPEPGRKPAVHPTARQEFEEDISFTDREFRAIELTLGSLPRNLKLKVQEIIGHSLAHGDNLRKLLNLLTRGASPSEIATLVSRITGQKITLPSQFEKKSGLEFETEKKSFSYVLKKNMGPLIAVLIPSLLVLALLVYLGIRTSSWIDAQSHYSRGIRHIEDGKLFSKGNEEFEIGYRLFPDNSWFYKYAEAFIRENQHSLAQEKYEKLLGLEWKGEKVGYMSNLDNKGILDYAAFESKILTDYQKAHALLDYLLSRDSSAKEALLASGDNYLDWADSEKFRHDQASLAGASATKLATAEEKTAELYELSRNAYAEFRNRFGDKLEVKLRFLRYFIRTDNYPLVKELEELFLVNTDVKVDPLIFAELGGYLIDKKDFLNVRDVLDRARKEDKSVPEIHYQYGRYFRQMDNRKEEETALSHAALLLNNAKPLSMKRILMLIDTHNRLGKLNYDLRKMEEAAAELDTAITLIENPQQRNLFGINPAFGEAYFHRANIFFDEKDLVSAQTLYTKARTQLYRNPDLDYKMGYINYWNGNYDDALLDFYSTEEAFPENVNALYAVANTLFMKDNYFSAEGYYEHLVEVLDKRKSGIENLRPKENLVHRALINYFMRSYNNLGVTLKRLAERPRNPKKESQALVFLTRSQEYYDILSRLIENPETMTRDKLTKSLAYLNQRAILYPVPGFELYIYRDLPTDTQSTNIDDLFSTKIKM